MHRGSAYLPLALIHRSTLVRNRPSGMEAVPDAVVSSLPPNPRLQQPSP